MLVSDTNKTYIIEETRNSFIIERNNNQQHYEVLESINSLSNDTFCVLNHLFVNEGNEEVFESRFLKRNQHLQDVPGFKALRFLRPVVKGDITLSSLYGTVDKLSMIGKIQKHMRKLIKTWNSKRCRSSYSQ